MVSGCDANWGSGAEPPTGLIGRISQSMTLEFRKCSVSFSDTLLLLCCFVFGGLIGCSVAVVGLCCSMLMFPPFGLSATRALFREIGFRHLRIDFNIVVCVRLARTCRHEEVE